MLHQDDLDDFVPGLVTEKGDDSFAGETGGAAESLVCFKGEEGSKSHRLNGSLSQASASGNPWTKDAH